MSNYKPNHLDQMKLIPVNFHRQIQPDSFEFTLHALIEDDIDIDIDLSVFDRHYKNTETGASAYDPAILLKIVL